MRSRRPAWSATVPAPSTIGLTTVLCARPGLGLPGVAQEAAAAKSSEHVEREIGSIGFNAATGEYEDLSKAGAGMGDMDF